jgi:DNA-binding CsgD family transcriptional regulator
LAPREREVAQLAAARWRSREIAERLGISARTVDNTLAKLYRKLEIAGRDDLARRLDELGLTDPSTPPPGSE